MLIDDPQHWRNRAEEARTVAESIADELSRSMMMLRIADDFMTSWRAAPSSN